MSYITIKRPQQHPQSDGPRPGTYSVKTTTPLSQLGEIRHGMRPQYLHYEHLYGEHNKFYMRTTPKSPNYLSRAQAKKIQGSLDQGYSSKDQQALERENKLARKGQEAFIKHILKYIKNAARHGQTTVELDLAEAVESFRQYRPSGAFDPYEHTRNFAVWLQHLVSSNNSSNPHLSLGQAVVASLRAASYAGAKLDTRHRKIEIKTPPRKSSPFALSSPASLQTISIPYIVLIVDTQPSNLATLSKLTPKTQEIIRHKIPSWIGGLFQR